MYWQNSLFLINICKFTGAGAHIRTSAGIGSSGCGTAGKQSDYIVQFGDALDVKPYLSIEVSIIYL